MIKTYFEIYHGIDYNKLLTNCKYCIITIFNRNYLLLGAYKKRETYFDYIMTKGDFIDESPKVVSPPPQPAPVGFDEKTLTHLNTDIEPGRLSIVCIEAANLRRKDTNESKTLLKPSIQITLGQHCQKSIVQTIKCQQSMNQNPSFNNEIMAFDIQNPQDILSHGTNDIKLKIEVKDESNLQSVIIGEVIISARRFFNGGEVKEWIPLLQNNDKSSNSLINLQFMYMPVREGMLMLTLMQCKDLFVPKTKTIPSQMRLVFSIGKKVKRKSTIIEEECGTPKYSSERIYLDVNRDNWFDAMNVQILNHTTNAHDSFGEHTLNLIPLMNKFISSEVDTLELSLHDHENSDNIAGKLELKAQFLHSSIMNIKVIEAKALKGNDIFLQKISPYIVIKSEGRSSCPKYTSKVIREGGTTPVWDEELTFLVIDHSMLSIECYDYDFVTDAHQLIGSGQLSLLPAYRTGTLSSWVTLSRSNEVGAVLSCGQVNIAIQFEDVGSSFPQLHESSTASKLKHVEGFTSPDLLQPLAEEIVHDMREKDDTGEEFTNEEIRSTFEFLDLDKNGYIGFSELRHVLINMGELITEREVDTMISMLDKNGDGQINFLQFEAMAKCKNFDDKGTNSHSTTVEVQKQSPLESNRIFTDEERRKVFEDFIYNNKIRKIDVSNVREYFLRRHKAFVSSEGQDSSSEDYSTTWALDFATFSQILPIAPTGESQKVFHLFDYDKDGVIDTRELILSLCNFMPSFSTEEKCSLMFELFDREGDHITAEDLEVILAGTHLKQKGEVSRKVQTIVKFVDRDGTSKVSRELLFQAAVKFPNLLLPKLSLR